MSDTRVCIGKFQVNRDVGDWLLDSAKLIMFYNQNRSLIEWCEEHISSFNGDRLVIITEPFHTYDEIGVWMPIDNTSDLMLWKLRPEWKQNEHI